MSRTAAWSVAGVIRTPRLTLLPLAVEHADEMARALGDPALHTFMGGSPATPDDLRRRYAGMVAGPAARTSGPTGQASGTAGREWWLNWVVRLDGDPGGAAPLVGWVQATVVDGDAGVTADVAWVVGMPWQRQGIAVEAAGRMVVWLAAHGVEGFNAFVHPEHVASTAVARALGFAATDEIVDGEIRWTRTSV